MVKFIVVEQTPKDVVRRPMIPIRLRTRSGDVDNYYSDYILEINKNRIFIRTEKPLNVGEQVHIEFNLKGVPRPVHLRGEVVRVSDGKTEESKILGPGMGIFFQNISYDDAKLINDYLHLVASPEMGKKYTNFLQWVRTLNAPLHPQEKERIKREWLAAIVSAAKTNWIPPTKGKPSPVSVRKPVTLKPAAEIEPLKKIQLFEDLTDEELSQLADICHKETFKAGEKIFEEGAIGDKFYMIQKGEVRISKIIQGIGEEALVVLKEGAYFGEMALIDEAPRSATAICNTNVVLLVIDKEDFEKLLHENHDIATKLLWTFVRTLSVRLRETNEKIKGFFAMTGGNQW